MKHPLIVAHRAILAASLSGIALGGIAFGGIAAAALAQTAPQHAYSDGAKLQPRPGEGEKLGSADTAGVQSLLDALAKDVVPNEPASGPTDIYGRPLGSNPGLNPPGLKAKPKS